MNKRAVCFTKAGTEIIQKLNSNAKSAGIRPVSAYCRMEEGTEIPGFINVTGSLSDWAEEGAGKGECIIFVSAVGIAVRSIAGMVRDKLKDSPVIVISDDGTFVIPILSGHAGGGNKIAITLAELIGAVPVITTSTDLHDGFSADTFAAENNLRIRNREGIKKVSAKALEGKAVTISIKDYPPKTKVDVIVADETDREYSLLLSPKPYIVGMGMKKDKNPEEAEEFFLRILSKADLTPEEIYAIATIDVKEEEPAIRQIAGKYRIPVLACEAGLLKKAEGDFHSSAFVEQTVGVDNVCERAAILTAGSGGSLRLPRTAENGMTIAIAKRGNTNG